MDEKKEKLVEFNGKKITEEQLLQEKAEAEKKKGMKVVEVSPEVYKTRIQE